MASAGDPQWLHRTPRGHLFCVAQSTGCGVGLLRTRKMWSGPRAAFSRPGLPRPRPCPQAHPGRGLITYHQPLPAPPRAHLNSPHSQYKDGVHALVPKTASATWSPPSGPATRAAAFPPRSLPPCPQPLPPGGEEPGLRSVCLGASPVCATSPLGDLGQGRHLCFHSPHL